MKNKKSLENKKNIKHEENKIQISSKMKNKI